MREMIKPKELKNNQRFTKIRAIFYLGVTTPLFIGFWSLYSRLTSDERFKKEIKPLFQIRSRLILPLLSFGSVIVAGMVTNWLVSFIRYTIGFLTAGGSGSFPTFDWQVVNLANSLDFSLLFRAPILTIPIWVVFGLVFYQLVKKYYAVHRDYNGNEQGDDRLITERELKKTYTKIPNRGKRFAGYGGVPVAHELKPGFDLSKFALKSKMICHFPRVDFENKTKENADEFVNDNDKWHIKKLAKIGKRISQCEQVLRLVKNPSGSYYIDQTTVNTLLTGMTRSGKGETFVNVMVDILSRAQLQASMVIGDPKGELFQMASGTLRKRGYNVQVLNYQNVDFSMSNNPLQLAKAYAQKGYYEKVQTEVDVVAESLYRQAKAEAGGNAKFWEDSSMFLFSALFMAMIWRAKMTKEWETVTVPNMMSLLNQLGSEFVWVDSEGTIYDSQLEDGSLEKKSKITVYFDDLRRTNKLKASPFLTMADNSFRQSNFAGEETKGSIFSSMLQGLKLFANDSIARMTSENNLDITTLGFPRQLSVKLRKSTNLEEDNPYANQIASLSILDKKGKPIINNKKVIVDVAGYLNFAIEPTLPNDFVIQIKLEKFDEKVTINVKKQFKKIKSIEIDRRSLEVLTSTKSGAVKKTKAQTTDGITIDEKDVEIKYSEQPTAVFLVMPPNKKAFGAMVSLFVDQVFNANYDMGLDNDRRLYTRIHFLLDEFGNLPMIPALDTKLSIGAGFGLLFDLVVQNLEQIGTVYGEKVAETILSNCSINEYIKSVYTQTM
ncbi:MAG: type IV secretory system conjugative DNA transfer family protein, partial [Alkalibacterium sp.]|nr:type IV secretory system conjugative DNA transfer family protein [Alkalibacterium sp.]